MCAPQLVATLALIGCARPESVFNDDRVTEQHAMHANDRVSALVFDRPAAVRFQMRRHFDDLRNIERSLVVGKLDEATTTAWLLARSTNDRGLAEWRAEATRAADAAGSLARASSLDEALHRAPGIAAACVDCHVRTRTQLRFAVERLPSGGPDPWIVHHPWAFDRLTEGVVGADGPRWIAGLEVFATETPTPGGSALRALAQHALAEPDSTWAARAKVYGELVSACTRCHRSR